MKKILLCILVGIFLINLASALPEPILVTYYNNEPLDFSIKPTATNNYNFETGNLPYKVYFKNNTNTQSAVRFEKEGYYMEYDVSDGVLEWRAQDEKPTASTTLGGGVSSNSLDTQIKINGNNISYAEAYGNTNLTYQILADRIKEELVLSGLPSIKNYLYLEYTGHLYFNKTLQICANEKCYIPSGAQDDFNTTGRIEFKTMENKTIFYLDNPIITDSAGNSIQGYYFVKGSNAQMIYELRIPQSFLASAVYPVFIDPTIVVYEWLNNTFYIYPTDTYDRNPFSVEIYECDGTKIKYPDVNWTEPSDNSENKITFNPQVGDTQERNCIRFKVNRFEESYTCKDTQYYHECSPHYSLNFEDFEAKNSITSRNITEVYEGFWGSFFDNFPFVWRTFTNNPDVQYYWLEYNGDITDLDPALVVSYTSASDVIFLNQTTVSSVGIGLTRNSTDYNVTQGDFKSFGFYNLTSTNWSITLGIDTKNMTNSTVIYSGTNVTLYTRTAENYNLSDPNLVAFWSFNNDNSSTAFDEMGMYNGDINETNTNPKNNEENGTVGKGYYFDGVNDYIRQDNVRVVRAFPITLTAWIKTTGNTKTILWVGNSTFSAGSVYGAIEINSTGGANTRQRGGNDRNCAGKYVNNNQWHYIVGYFKNTTYNEIYVDGVLSNSCIFAAANMFVYPYDRWAIGYAADITPGGYFLGSIDEVKIYNRSLSANEILDLYNLGVTHINWDNNGEWTNEGVITSNVAKSSSDSGNFMQFKAELNTNDSTVSPYVNNHSISSYTPAGNCWTTISGTPNILFIPNGCVYPVLQGNITKI